MTPADCIRAAIPDATDELVDYIVWGRSPFPFKRLGARDFYKAASGFKRASDRGIRLCDHCNNIAINEEWCCQKCADALNAPHPDDNLSAHTSQACAEDSSGENQ